MSFNNGKSFSCSEETRTLMPLLLDIQKELKGFVKDKENAYYEGHKFVTLNHLLTDLRPLCHERGIIILQPMFPTYGERLSIGVSTVLLHAESGEWIESAADMPLVKENPQQAGSAISFGRRYTLLGVLAMQALDDDGEESMDRTEKAIKDMGSKKSEKQNSKSPPTKEKIEAVEKAVDKAVQKKTFDLGGKKKVGRPKFEKPNIFGNDK